MFRVKVLRLALASLSIDTDSGRSGTTGTTTAACSEAHWRAACSSFLGALPSHDVSAE